MEKFRNSKNFHLFCYKLFLDAFTVLAILFLLALTFDSILPGIISSKINLTEFFMLAVILLMPVLIIGQKYNLDFQPQKKVRSAIFSVFIFIAIILFLNLLNFDRWETVLISVLTLVIVFYFYKIFMTGEKD